MLRKHLVSFWYCVFLQLLPVPRLGSPLALQIAWHVKHFSTLPSSGQTFSLALVLSEWLTDIPNLHPESHVPLVCSGMPGAGNPRNAGLVRGELGAAWECLSEITPHRSKPTCTKSQGCDTWLPAQPCPTLPSPAPHTRTWEKMGVSGVESLQLAPTGPKQSGQLLELLDRTWWIGCHGNMLGKMGGSHGNREHPCSHDCRDGDFLRSPRTGCV